MEDPCYLLLQLKLIKARDFKIITVPRLDDGPDLAAMEAMLIKYRPKLFLTQTLVHNRHRRQYFSGEGLQAAVAGAPV